MALSPKAMKALPELVEKAGRQSFKVEFSISNIMGANFLTKD
jgi:hypothetical protein